jgi:hypothetical protein
MFSRRKRIGEERGGNLINRREWNGDEIRQRKEMERKGNGEYRRKIEQEKQWREGEEGTGGYFILVYCPTQPLDPFN